MIRAARVGFCVLVMLVLGTASAAAAGPANERVLFQRLFSPCCYRETLDIHVSPLAEELRTEVRTRLSRGEAPDRIVADMVARYGDGVLTRPPRPATAIAIFGGAGLLVAGLIGIALRRTRRAPPVPAVAEPRLPRNERHLLEDRLTDELSAID